MRRTAIIFSLLFVISIPFDQIIGSDNTQSVEQLSNDTATDGTVINKRSVHRTGSRDTDWFSTLVDSSKNGYGAYLETPNPLAYSIDNGWVAVYRQWGGFDATAGYIGVAQSEDGEEWYVEQRVNTAYPEGVEEPDLPTATGTPQGRYPSAAVSSEQNSATAIWNEYTNGSNGGGTYGGRPMFVFDFFSLGEQSNFSSVYNLNNGCATFPCDPPDLWNGNIQMVDGDDGTTRLFAAYNSWAGGTDAHMIRSLNITNGYITPADPYIFTDYSNEMDDEGNCLWYECSGYTGTADFHVNNDGVGYMANTSWTANSDFEEPYLHTIFFKKTEDYGETWTSDEGYMNSGYYYMADSVIFRLSDSLYTLWSNNTDMYPEMPWYPWAECTDDYGDTYTCGDTIMYDDSDNAYFFTPGWFIHYAYDMITDQDGGFHFVAPNYPFVCLDVDGGCEDSDGDGLADSLYWENRMGGAGMMHFYNPDPIESPNAWTANLIQDFSDAYYADWTASDIPTLNDPIYYFYPQISPSFEEGSEVLWYGAFNMSAGDFDPDTVFYLPSDMDLYMAKSTDMGMTWSEPENVTNTPGGIFPDKQLEVGIHLASVGSDTEIGVFYQMPEFTVETYPPAGGYEDYMNRVYVGVYTNDEGGTVGLDEGSLVPDEFILRQNYPNPFNPLTHISYSLKTAGEVHMDLYDVRGNWVRSLVSGMKPAGGHEYVLDASDMSSGLYFYTMAVNGSSKTRKLVLMK